MTKDIMIYACPWRDSLVCPRNVRYASDEIILEALDCHAGPLYFKGTTDSVCYVTLDPYQTETDRNAALAEFPNRFDWIGTNNSSHNEESE